MPLLDFRRGVIGRRARQHHHRVGILVLAGVERVVVEAREDASHPGSGLLQERICTLGVLLVQVLLELLEVDLVALLVERRLLQPVRVDDVDHHLLAFLPILVRVPWLVLYRIRARLHLDVRTDTDAPRLRLQDSTTDLREGKPVGQQSVVAEDVNVKLHSLPHTLVTGHHRPAPRPAAAQPKQITRAVTPPYTPAHSGKPTLTPKGGTPRPPCAGEALFLGGFTTSATRIPPFQDHQRSAGPLPCQR